MTAPTVIPAPKTRCQWLARCTNRATHWAVDTRNPSVRWAVCEDCANAPTHQRVVQNPETGRWS